MVRVHTLFLFLIAEEMLLAFHRRVCQLWVCDHARAQPLSQVRVSVTLWTAVPRLLCPWDFPGENAGVGCRLLLQGLFPGGESNLRLLH